MINPYLFPLMGALGVLLTWLALTSPPRVDVAAALRLGESARPRRGLDGLDDRFRRAGLSISTRELLSASLWLAAIVGALAFVITRQIGFAVLMALLVPLALYQRAEARRDAADRAYQEGLVGAMDVIRASYSTMPDIRAAVRDAALYAPDSIRGDFEQVNALLVQGSGLEEAFAPVQAMRRNMFLDMLVEAIALREQEGGSISDVLANIQDLIREQGRIFQRTMARQTQARLEITIVCLAPAAFFVFLRVALADYEQGFYDTVTGQLILVGAFILDVAAYFLSRTISRSGLELARYETS